MYTVNLKAHLFDISIQSSFFDDWHKRGTDISQLIKQAYFIQL